MDGAFTVTPMTKTIELKPGEVYQGSILISNPEKSKSDFSYKVTAMPYGVTGTGYDADFISNNSSTKMADWIKISNPTGTISPNGKQEINYSITVPADAPGGGQYAALVISQNDDLEIQDGVGVQDIYGMASLIYATIDGEIIREGEVLENSIPGFVTGFPAISNVMIKNDGNVHEPANIYLEIKNAFNGEVIYPKEGSGGIQEEIMPGTTRYLSTSIQDISPLGIYKVTQTIDYLGKVNETSQIMIACPVWFLFLVFVTVCSIISYIVSRIIKRKKIKGIK